MGVDEHLLKKGMPRAPVAEPDFDERSFAPAMSRVADSANMLNRKLGNGEPQGIQQLRSEIRKLTDAIGDLLEVFKKAHEDIRAEPTAELAAKMDKLVEQNEEIGRALLMLLELHREHLPQISKHTRISSEMRLRKPSRLMFPGGK